MGVYREVQALIRHLQATGATFQFVQKVIEDTNLTQREKDELEIWAFGRLPEREQWRILGLPEGELVGLEA